jgi:hypothetical protein
MTNPFKFSLKRKSNTGYLEKVKARIAYSCGVPPISYNIFKFKKNIKGARYPQSGDKYPGNDMIPLCLNTEEDQKTDENDS